MDSNNWRPPQADQPPPMDSGDWRTQFQPDSRQKIINKILETLRRHSLVSGEEELQKLRKIAVCFEERIYSAATSQSDYLRKISLKMLTMESKSQTSSGSRMDTLKRHSPFSGQEGLQELKKIAVRFKEKIYSSATSQSDYMRRISVKMPTMESKSQNTIPNGLPSNSTGGSRNPSGPDRRP